MVPPLQRPDRPVRARRSQGGQWSVCGGFAWAWDRPEIYQVHCNGVCLLLSVSSLSCLFHGAHLSDSCPLKSFSLIGLVISASCLFI